MSDERKLEKEIFFYSVYRGEQTYAKEMKRNWRNLGTESCLTVGNESGDKGEITVSSIKFTKTSRSKEKLVYKNPSSTFFLLQNLHSPRVYSPEDQLSSRLEDSRCDTKTKILYIQEIWEQPNWRIIPC